ncbi:PA domain-containing protein [Lentibacillus halodurans]|uniref:PA domain-containing protein n=1 Tax=Lentibacillus halodurans TaxID=237679 RepID=A0A1I0XHP8_9BACI|nr:M14 family zinc carboxypeptidase [Lentibacillus halodurans]SFA99810.1 PA domain-containing protein [Lentibacillus halodurans]
MQKHNWKRIIPFLLILSLFAPMNLLTGMAASNDEREGYVSEIASGPLAGKSFDYFWSEHSTRITDAGPIDGEVIYVGKACDDSDQVPEAMDEDDVALVERGDCLFVEKIDNIEGNGYSAVLLFNDQRTDDDGCDAFPSSMSTSASIPMLAISRTVGLQLLGETGSEPVPCPDGPETESAVGTVGEKVFILNEFDPNSTETGFEQRNGNGWTVPSEEAAFLETVAEESERVTYTEAGTSVEGRPIHLVRVGYPVPPSDEEIANGRNILIQGTPHGNEPAGQEMALQLLRDLAFTDDSELLEQLSETTILFMPTPNPDGREANQRGNSWGVDNNRDHLNLDTPEIQTLAKVMNKFSPEITIDAHERPSGASPEMEMVWPRNLNIDGPLRELSKEMVQDYLMPDVEEAGFTTGIYGSPNSSTNGNERVLSNMLGLRHGIGLITESAGRAKPEDRVEMQMETALSVMRFYRERFDDVVQAVTEAPERKAADGANREPFYLDGADNREPPEWAVLDPASCGYLINSSQEEEISRHIDLFSLRTEEVSGNGVFVTMNQSMMTVIPLLLDEQARYNELSGLALEDCSNPGELEPPLGAPSLANLRILADRFASDGEFANDEAARAVTLHLTAVSQFEEQGETEKVVKHLDGLLELLQHQRENELITEEAYHLIEPQADSYMKELQYAFYQGFVGDDGNSWDSSDFVNLDSWPTNPDGAVYTIQDNTGQIDLDNRQQGNGSAYGRVTPYMEDTENSELLVRFKANEIGNNQRMRLWLQSDAFSPGSSMPVNGYGVELNLNTNELILRGRYDSSSTNFDRIDANMSDEWHWVRLRKQDDELMVRLWHDDSDEPAEWDMVHTLSADEQLPNQSGKTLLSVINFDYDSSNRFNFDEIIVSDLDQ